VLAASRSWVIEPLTSRNGRRWPKRASPASADRGFRKPRLNSVTGIAPDEAANGIMLVATLPGHLAEHLAEAAGTRTVARPAEIGPTATPRLGTLAWIMTPPSAGCAGRSPTLSRTPRPSPSKGGRGRRKPGPFFSAGTVCGATSHPRPSRQSVGARWWALEDSNLRPQPCEGCALTT
jgi:hypothetical protein